MTDITRILLDGEAFDVPSEDLKTPKPKKFPTGKNKRWLPLEGYVWNPVLAVMKPNEKCLCGSGRKWKKCCLQQQPRVVKKAVAEAMMPRIQAMKDRNAERAFISLRIAT